MRRVATITALLVCATLPAACAEGDDGAAPAGGQAVPTAAPSSTPTATTTASATPGAASFPLTFANCGVQVTVEAAPERVVLLDASAVRQLDAVGAMGKVVARAGEYPPDYFSDEVNARIKAIPQLTSDQTSVGGVDISLESIVDAEPDLVIGYATATITRDALSKLDIPMYVIPSYCDGVQTAPTFDTVLDEVTFYGNLFGNPQAAAGAVDGLRRQLSERSSAVVPAGTKGAALFVASDGSALYTYSALGMVSTQMERLGLTNVFKSMSERSPEISVEALIDAAPDVLILLYTDVSKSPEEITGLVTGLSGADTIPAVRSGKVVPLLLNFSEPPSPLVVDGLGRLADKLRS